MSLFKRKNKEKDKLATEKEDKKQSQKVVKEKTVKKEEQKKVVEKNTKEKKEEKKKSVPKKAVYRVLYDKENRCWLIKKDGAKRTITSYPTKEEALNRVKELSESNDLSFVVHKKDGKFQKK